MIELENILNDKNIDIMIENIIGEYEDILVDIFIRGMCEGLEIGAKKSVSKS